MTLIQLLAVEIGGNSVQDYLQTLVIFFLFFFGFCFAYHILIKRLETWAKHASTDIAELMVAMLSRLGNAVFFVLALYFSTSSLRLPPAFQTLIHALLVIIITFRCTFLVQEALRYAIRHAYQRKRAKNDPIIESTVSNIIGVLRWIIWLAAMLFLLDNLGVNITTMVAGIGITGIAVGLAAQTILGDAFSAFAIFLDKPFEVGDFVTVDNYMGNIEHIGIKTTRIRSLSGEELIFANSDLTKSRIKNYKRMGDARGVINFSLAFSTPAEKLRQARDLTQEIIKTTPHVRIDHVHLMNFGPSAYTFEAAYYVETSQIDKSMDIQQEICFQIAERLAKIGIIAAPPAQDIIVKKIG
jgi:small-conductance mechanosensitive channel